MSGKFISDKKVGKRYGVHRTTIWRWVAEGSFPPPVKISPGCTRWDLSVIEKHEAAKGKALREVGK